MKKPIIKLSQVNKTYKTRGNKNILTGIFDPKWKYSEVISNLDFDIYSGEAVAFLGANGAGKTTTTKMMTGLISPTAGEVDVLGYKPFDKDNDFLKQIGLVMGNRAGLNWDLTARQSFGMMSMIYDIDGPEGIKRAQSLGEMLGCDQHFDTQLRKLSLGERMKMEMIGAIMHRPKVLFLDEPTIGLDIKSKATLRDFLKKINQEQGVTLVLTSHDMDDVEEVCQRAIVIDSGDKIFDGDLGALGEKYAGYKYIKVTSDQKIKDTDLAKIGKVIKSDGGLVLRVKQKDLGKSLAELSKYDLVDISIESVPLERIMADLVSDR